MKHAPLLAVVLVLVLALLAALGLGWLDLGFSPDTNAVESDAETHEVLATPATGPDVPDLETTSSVTETRERASVAAAAETARAGSTLRGRVLAPDGAPADPTLEVFVLRVPHGNASLAHALDRRDANEHLDPSERREREAFFEDLIARTPVAPDGGFEAELPEGARVVFLQVRGRYLFLRAARRADVGAEARVTPELGGWVTGRLVAPEVEGASLVDVPVVVFPRSGDSASPMGGFGAPGDVFSVVDLSGTDGRFEFRAVPATAGYTVAVLPPAESGVAATRDTELDFEPGEHVQIEIEVATGGRVKGRVVDAAGRGVEGAEVGAALPGRFFGLDDLPARDVESGADGSFELLGVPFGRMKVQADHERYLESSSALVEVPAVGAAEGVRLVLTEGRTITGRVTHEGGAPAAGVRVDASFDPAHIAGMTFFNSLRGASAHAETDDEGAFVLRGLGGGPFVVQARIEGDEGEPTVSARLDGVRPGVDGLALVLRPPLGVHGRVVDTAGEPLTSFSVVAERKAAGEFLTLTVARRRGDFRSDEGAFFLAGLSEGTWEVGVEGDGWLSLGVSELQLPADTESEPLVITVERAVTVRGRVLAPDGQPRSGATIQADTGAPGWMGAITDTRAPRTAAEEGGTFELGGLPAGKGAVYATAPGFARSASASIDAAPGDVVEDVELSLTRGGTLTGEVLGDDGDPAGGRMITMNHLVNMTTRVATTDAGGLFEARNLPPGHWQVVAMDASADWSGTDTSDMGAMMAGLDLAQAEIVEGETTHLVIGEPPADPVQVSGEVTHDGRPWSGALVSFYPEGSRLYERLAFSSVKDDGTYSMELPEPGPYVVSIQKIAGGGAQQNTLEFAEVVPSVAEHRIDFEIPLGRISGRVLAPGGEGAAGARVTLTPDEAQRTDSFFGGQYTEITAAEDGRYDVEGLRPGRYRLSAGGAPIYNPGAVARFGRVTRGGLVVGEDEWLQGVDLSLPAPGSLDVTVVDGGGAPVAQATVFVRDAEGRVLEPFAVLTTDGSGRCEYPGVAPGEYTVSARTAGLASPESAAVKLAEGGRAAVKLVLEESTILWIKVKDGEGEPLRASLRIEDDDGRDVGDMFGMQDLQVLYLEGAFSPTEHRLGPLPPGRYKVYAESGGEQASKSVRLRGEPEKTMTLRIR